MVVSFTDLFFFLTSETSFGKCLKSVDIDTYFGIVSVEHTCWTVGLCTYTPTLLLNTLPENTPLTKGEINKIIKMISKKRDGSFNACT